MPLLYNFQCNYGFVYILVFMHAAISVAIQLMLSKSHCDVKWSINQTSTHSWENTQSLKKLLDHFTPSSIVGQMEDGFISLLLLMLG